jgi:hypothetical protein
MTCAYRVSFWNEDQLQYTYISTDDPMTARRNVAQLYPRCRIEKVELIENFPFANPKPFKNS